MAIRVLVWNEGRIKKNKIERVLAMYPEGIHGALRDVLCGEEFSVTTATLDDFECGLTEEVLNNTDVILWWGHSFHKEVPDELVERVTNRVLMGCGFIALHSAHYSKPFKKLMGTTCALYWHDTDRERLWVTAPYHPIAKGLPSYIELPIEEMYGEFFDIPKPDDVVFTGWFAGGQVFRSGCTFTRGYGRIFYFQPGHETYPTYKDENIKKIIRNAVKWAAPVSERADLMDHEMLSLED